jgi:hypothetical protein
METKTKQAQEKYIAGDFIGSLRLFHTFRIGMTKDERDVIKTAYEIMTGKGSFYAQLGIDTDAIVNQSRDIIETKLIRL